MKEQILENFLNNYILHTKILKPKFIANRFCKEVLYILPERLKRKTITPELRQKRQKLTKQFLKIIKKRNYKKEGNLYFAD